MPHEKRFNPEKAAHLLNRDRYLTLPPEEIIQHLAIEDHEVLADFGCGNGFFTIPLAKQTRSSVYAIDLEKKMLALLKERADEAGIHNLTYIINDLHVIPIADHEVNKWICSLVLHEVDDLDQTIREFKRVMKPTGQGLIIEWAPKQTHSGPPLHHRITPEELQSRFQKHGLDSEVVPVHDDYYALLVRLTK